MSEQNRKLTYYKYLVAEVPRFDQINTMFNRARSDPMLLPWGNKFYGIHPPKEKPGYRLLDSALRNASWYVERGFGHGNFAGNTGLFSWECEDPKIARTIPGLRLEVKDPEEMSREVKKAALTLGASLAGICEFNPAWAYSHYYHPLTKEHEPLKLPAGIKYAIALGLEMDYDMIQTSPTNIAGAATGLGYSRMAFVAGLLAQFIRCLGYRAIPSGNDTALSIPIAIDAGLGELGRNGLLITPAFGPRVRLCKVLTDLPLKPDPAIDIGVQAFCEKCVKCAEKCPSKAILPGERIANPLSISNNSGLLKWPLDAERCFKYWAANQVDCAICIRTCPFNKPVGRLHDFTRLLIKNAPWLNKGFVWLDDFLGYGKEAIADKFWDS